MSETQPILTLDDLLTWNEESVKSDLIGNSLKHYKKRNGPETLICHDMKGGYLPEERLGGCMLTDSCSPYIFLHWWYVDIFVYFSHHLITIPPVGWINQAHNHGVLVLGTFITEFEKGEKLCERMFTNDNTEKIANKLASIAAKYNFDGWLLNIENKIENCDILNNVSLFLKTLCSETKRLVGNHGRVIWYDSLTCDGKLKYQNELNEKNETWFNLSSGIFLNYRWKEGNLANSALRGKNRLENVFVGIDCFGRGCFGGGGWNCNKAFIRARHHGLSVALFAPGWVAENLPYCGIIPNSLKFWNELTSSINSHSILSLPFKTDFSIGFVPGKDKFFDYGCVQLHPHYIESKAYPDVIGKFLVLPEAGDYKLFITDLWIERKVFITIKCDSSVTVLLWKDDNDHSEVIENIFDNGNNEYLFRLHYSNYRILGLGLRSVQKTLVHYFSVNQAPNVSFSTF